MNLNKKLFLIMALILLLVTISAAAAANNTQDNKISDTPTKTVEKTSVTKNVEKQAVTKDTTKNNNITKKITTNTKKEAKTVILNNSNFESYLTEPDKNSVYSLNDEINNGDTLDVRELIIRPNTKLAFTKSLNIISTTNIGGFSFYGSGSGHNIYFRTGSSGSNVTGITFDNTQLSVNSASDIKFDNITLKNIGAAIGNGIGAISIREGSENITLTNSYLTSQNNGGHSCVVYAVAYNCLFENNTVYCENTVGNMFYFTTYNIDTSAYPVPNSENITVRNNTFIGVNTPTTGICYGLMLSGNGHIIENNYLEKQSHMMSIQWVDPGYQGEGQTSTTTEGITFRGNHLKGNSNADVYFNGKVYNNTFDVNSAAVSLADTYNNTFRNVDIKTGANFFNNTATKIIVSDLNNNISNIAGLKSLEITSSRNNISNIVLNTDNRINVSGSYNTLNNISLNSTSDIYVNGNYNVIKNSDIKSKATFAITLNGANNNVTNNNIVAASIQGNTAVKTSTNNIIANNTPEASSGVQITDENYYEYFDDDGNNIAIPDNSVISLSGTFNNKDFIFSNIHGIVAAQGVTLYNSTIVLKNNTQLGFNDQFTINNRNSEKKTVLIIESDNNDIPNRLTIMENGAKSNFTTIIVKGNNNVLNAYINSYNDTNYENPYGTGLVVEGENNKITYYWYENNSPGQLTGAIFTPTSKNNTITGVSLSFTNSLKGSNPRGIIVSGEGNYLYNMDAYMPYNSAKSVIIENADYTVLNNVRVGSNYDAIKVNNSDNVVIENSTQIYALSTRYPIQIYNSDNVIIRSNFIRNNQSYGGDDAILVDDTSVNVTIAKNTNTAVDLSDETYDSLFVNNIINRGNVINIVGDIHNKTMIFDIPVTINANGYTLYNSPITVEKGRTNITNININATDIPTALTLNGETVIDNINISHTNQEMELKSIIINNITLTANKINMDIKGPAIRDSTGYDFLLPDCETDITTAAVDVTGKGLFLATDINVNVTSTMATIGKIAAFKHHDMEILRGGAFSRLTRANINVISEADAVGILGSYELQSGTQNINVTGNNVYGIILNEDYNQTLYNINLNINAKNDAIGIMKNETSYKTNSHVNSGTLNINANGTAIGILANNTLLRFTSVKININATNVIGLCLNNFTRDINSHTLTLKGNNVTGILLTNSEYNPSIRNTAMNSNTINITAQTGYAIQLNDVSSRSIRLNKINTTVNGPSILVEDSSNVNITENTIPNGEYSGNFAIELINSPNVINRDNLPVVALILTDENYDEHFTNGLFTSTLYDKIQLGSDLKNKNLNFNKTIVFDGNGYTIYNGTLSKEASNTLTFENTTINNTNIPAMIISGQINLNNNTIIFNGNNKEIIVLKNSTTISNIRNNNVIVSGDENTVISFNKYPLSQTNSFSYNNITSTGERNTIIYYANTTSTTHMTYNNIKVNTNEAVTEVIIENANLNFNNNNITINSTHEDQPIVKVTNGTGTVNYNNIESLDLKGKLAIDTPGSKIGNTPIVSILLTDENYDEYFENSVLKLVVDYIELGSDLYNKDLIFTDALVFKGNNFTIYNGTIKTNSFDSTNITNVNFNNVGKAVLVTNGSLCFLNNTVYYEGNNNNILIIDNSTSSTSEITGNTIIINGDDNTVILSNNYTYQNNKFINNNITITGDRNTAINYNTSGRMNYITYNNITVNTNEPTTEVIMDGNYPVFNNNRIMVNSTHSNAPIVKLITPNTNGQANNNYIESLDITGSAGIETTVTRNGNTPKMNIILTDDNYDTYFQDGKLKYAVDYIELGSDLYNKDLMFTSAVPFNGNNYTIYNGTITIKGTNIYSNEIFYLNYTKIYNTDDRTSSVIAETFMVSLYYCDIYQEGNNKQVIVFKDFQNTPKLNQYNNITVKGNNNYVIYANNYYLSINNAISYNNITLIGENNVAFYCYHSYASPYFRYNNITVYATQPSTPIYLNSSAYIQDNNIIVNTTQGDTPIVLGNNDRSSYIYSNYIESFDIVGNDAVTTRGTNRNNNPTATSGFKATINIEEKTLNISTENRININVTDSFDRPINGTLTVTVNGETVEVIENTITYTPTTGENITIKATYKDDKGKYSSTTKTVTLPVYVPKSTTNVTTEEVILGDTTNLTAAFYTDEGLPVNNGKAIFRVNGKTLRYENGTVIYVDVVDGQATLSDVNITSDWMKPDTTIQAIYTGTDEFEPIITEKIAVNVTKPKATIEITAPTEQATAGQTITLTAKVTEGENNIGTGRVAFKLNGKTLKDADGKALYANVQNGIATTTYTIPEKTKAKLYNLTAVFTDTKYDRVEAESTLNIIKT